MGSNGTLRFERVPPEPGRFWIRFKPRQWPGPPGWWIDLARAEPAADALRTTVSSRVFPEFDDAVYLPPLSHDGLFLRQEIVQRCSDLGVPAIQQIVPGEQAPVGEGLVVVDLTESLLHRRLTDISGARNCWVAWPLIPALTDDDELRSRGLEYLARQDVAGVLPIPLTLSPRERRHLAEFGSAASYGELFHGDQSAAFREFVAEISTFGLSVFPPRPALAVGRRTPNRELATHFSLLAELWLGCGRPPGRAQKFFAVARSLEDERADVSELARRGGLTGIEWLDFESREEILVAASGRRTPLMLELEAELFGPGAS